MRNVDFDIMHGFFCGITLVESLTVIYCVVIPYSHVESLFTTYIIDCNEDIHSSPSEMKV